MWLRLAATPMDAATVVGRLQQMVGDVQLLGQTYAFLEVIKPCSK